MSRCDSRDYLGEQQFVRGAWVEVQPPTDRLRELIAELAAVEDAIGRAPLFVPSGEPAPAAAGEVNPQLLALVDRESLLVAALRAGPGSRPHRGHDGS